MSAPVTITGWVGNNPAVTLTTNDRRRTTVRVATTHRYRDDKGAWTDGETTWYSVTFWDDAAERVARSLHRGEPVIVTGRLVLERWDAPDGSPRAELALRGATIGHDLTRGTASFTRYLREARPAVDAGEAGDAAGVAAPRDEAHGFARAASHAPDPFTHEPSAPAADDEHDVDTQPGDLDDDLAVDLEGPEAEVDDDAQPSRAA